MTSAQPDDRDGPTPAAVRGVKRGAFPTSERDLAAADRYIPEGDTVDESPEPDRPALPDD